MDIIDKVKMLMDESGLSKSEFARKMDITPQHLNILLTKKQDIRISTIQRIADALNKPVSYFFIEQHPVIEEAKNPAPQAKEPTDYVQRLELEIKYLKEINTHLQTTNSTLQNLVSELVKVGKPDVYSVSNVA